MNPTRSNIDGPGADRGRRLAAYAREQTAGADGSAARLNIAPPAGSLPGYDLLHDIGRGAQGVVYEAFHHATKRRVAAKIMHESSSAGVRHKARFQQEIEVLAQLRHPNIVTVYDGGVTPSGRFFLVMELIDGEPIDDYVAVRDPSVPDILGLFLKVCDAVNAAHLRGVVHRDLKPSNIRVDATGEPHVIDFGLVKILETDAKTSDSRAVSVTGDFLGSLPWASPEQAAGARDRIDIRTDVYALGVILFHALTGRFPYDVVGAMRIVMDNILRAEPPRPSALSRGLDDDIDTIVLKCLSKDRERRYQSAGELARDIERCLNHEPIEAKRDSTWYVVSCLVRRHRAGSIATASALVLLVGFAVTVTVLLGQARAARSDAQAHAARAEAANRELQNTASFMVTDVAPILKELPRTSGPRKRLLDITLDNFGRLIGQGDADPASYAGRAKALDALSDLAVQADRRGDALARRLEALSIREKLVREHPDTPDFQRGLALSYVLVGDLKDEPDERVERRTLYEKAFAIEQNLAARFPEDLRVVDDLVYSYERLGSIFLYDGDYVGANEYFQKQFALAQSLVERAPEKASSHWAVLCSIGQLANMDELRGEYESARSRHLESLAIAKRLVEMEPDRPDFMRALVSTMSTIASDQCNVPFSPAPMETLVSVEPLLRRFVDMEPEDRDRQRNLAEFYESVAGAYLFVSDYDGAERTILEACRILEKTGVDAPDHPDQLRLELRAATYLAVFAHRGDDVPRRQEFAAKAVERAEKLLQQRSSDPATALNMAMFWLACEIPETCDPARAETLARRSIELSQNTLPRPWLTLARALHALGRVDEACHAVTRALELFPSNNQGFRVDATALTTQLRCGAKDAVFDEQPAED